MGISTVIAVEVEVVASMVDEETLVEADKVASTAEQAIEETLTISVIILEEDQATSKAVRMADEEGTGAVIEAVDSEVAGVTSAEEEDSVIAVEEEGNKRSGRRTTDTVPGREVEWEVVERNEMEEEWTEDTAIKNVRDINSALFFCLFPIIWRIVVIVSRVRRLCVDIWNIRRCERDFDENVHSFISVQNSIQVTKSRLDSRVDRMNSSESNWNTESPNGAEDAESGITSVLAKEGLVKYVRHLGEYSWLILIEFGLILIEISSKLNKDSPVSRFPCRKLTAQHADSITQQPCSTESPSCKENPTNSKNLTRYSKPVSPPLALAPVLG